MRTQSPGTQQWHRPPTLHPTPAGPQAQPDAIPVPHFQPGLPAGSGDSRGAGSAKPPSSPHLLGSDLVRRGSAGSTPRTPLGFTGLAVQRSGSRFGVPGSGGPAPRPPPRRPSHRLARVPLCLSVLSSPPGVLPCACSRAQARDLTAGGSPRRRLRTCSPSERELEPAPPPAAPGPAPARRRGGATRGDQGPPTPARWHPPELSSVPALSSSQDSPFPTTSSAPPLVGAPYPCLPFPPNV